MRAALIGWLMLAVGEVAAAAQPAGGPPPARLTLWGGLTAAPSAAGGALATDYAPMLQGAGGYTSRASQTLNVDLAGGAGLAAGADVFFSRRVGLQAAFAYRRADLTGLSNGDYQVYLRYTSLQPPDYQPREVVIDRAEAWPDTTGRCSLKSLQIGVVVWAGPAGGRVEGTFAGGLSLDRAAADLESVGYTEFRLGGHAVLFDSQSHMAISTADTGTIVRPYLAGDVGFRAGRHAWLFAGVRARLGGTLSLTATPARVLDPDGALWAPDLAEVERVLTMEPLRLATPHWEVVAGLRVAVN